MRIITNPGLCVGAGNCVFADSEVFDQDDDGRVVVRHGEAPARHDDAVREAVLYCPSGAIALEED